MKLTWKDEIREREGHSLLVQISAEVKGSKLIDSVLVIPRGHKWTVECRLKREYCSECGDNLVGKWPYYDSEEEAKRAAQYWLDKEAFRLLGVMDMLRRQVGVKEWAQKQLKGISAVADDPEAAHSLEDKFRGDILRLIVRETVCPHARNAATYALSTGAIEFSRGCA